MPRLSALASSCDTPLVATGDVLYHAPHRRPLQDVLSCVREKTTIRRAGLKLEANAERHLKWPAEMARLFRGHEDALARTLEIAEACRFSLDELVYEYPDEPTPPGKTPQAHLEELAWEGAHWRFPDGIPEKVHALIARELQLIAELEYAPVLPHRARHRALRPLQGHPLPGARLGRQLRRLLLPRHHRGRPRPRSTCCSSASSRPSARSRPTSTSTSSTSGARR